MMQLVIMVGKDNRLNGLGEPLTCGNKILRLTMQNPERNITEEIAVLWTKAQPTVSAYITSIVHSFQDSDDILQQVAVSIIKNFDNYDRDRSFVAWAIGIAKNEILMYRRKNAQKVVFPPETIQIISDAYEKQSLNLDETRRALEVCITKLKGRSRKILRMRYFSELSVSRIADKLGATQASVYTSFHRIRMALRDCINRQLSSREDV